MFTVCLSNGFPAAHWHGAEHLLGVHRNCTNTTIKNNCKKSIKFSKCASNAIGNDPHTWSISKFFVVGALALAVLLATWCVRAKSKTGEPDHCQNSKHPGHVHSTSTCRLFRRPCSPIFSDIGATIEHEQSLSCTRCCQPRTTSRRGQHADRDRHSQSRVATA